ncbi:protease Lon-related BREX system protein BrxL [Lactiplantibacillus plantarum]|nr:protease Lon-related BREX system protein BrxL [Lactiplantibacillus plantarum]MCG0885408.1 protease Lon-related BREX system protein BrxL [Lactiplantibacillus plantarum]
MTSDNNHDELSQNDETLLKLEQNLRGRFVRKDLTQRIKEGANVPIYVLEFLLGQFANSSDEKTIEQGVENFKKNLAHNFVRPDEAKKVKSKIREDEAYTVIDKLEQCVRVIMACS